MLKMLLQKTLDTSHIGYIGFSLNACIYQTQLGLRTSVLDIGPRYLIPIHHLQG